MSALRQQLIGRLRQHADDVRRITDGLGDAALQRRVEPEQWSLAELVCHILRVQVLFEGRLDAMLEREEPAFEAYAPEGDAGFAGFVTSQGGRRAVEGFVTERNRFAGRLDALAPGQWLRRARHPTFATFDVDFLVEYMLHHEAHHMYQMFMRRMKSGSGVK